MQLLTVNFSIRRTIKAIALWKNPQWQTRYPGEHTDHTLRFDKANITLHSTIGSDYNTVIHAKNSKANPGLVKFFISTSDRATCITLSLKSERLGQFIWFSILQHKHFGSHY